MQALKQAYRFGRRQFLFGGGALALAADPAYKLDQAADAFLEDLSRRSFQFFWERSDPRTGITRDRARTNGDRYPDSHLWVGSIASTGFGLAGLAIAAERGWLSRDDARERTRATLAWFANEAYHDRGRFHHWMDIRSGERMWKSEISTIDTALLLGGVLSARQYWRREADIVKPATAIYERMDFPYMQNGAETLTHGIRVETGFIRHRWATYSEHAVLYMLGIGSPTHPLPGACWRAFERNWNEYKGTRYLGRSPLFTHQYSHAFVDFRGRRENFPPNLDYFANSVTATRVHRQFCIDLAGEFPGYGPNMWGITASDSRKGYVAWSGPPRHPRIDGTVVPCAAAGSLMFAPDICVPALLEMKQRFGDKIYGRYGFADAFHPTENWVNPDVIGIDVGITLLAAENLRSGHVWRWFNGNPEIPRALDRAGILRV